MQALRVGIVGLGHNGRAWVSAYQAHPGTEAAALCDLWPERLSEAGELAPGAKSYDSIDEMLRSADLDVLSVHTPDHLHAEPFTKGLEAGCHVVVEKPMANSIEDLEEAVHRVLEDTYEQALEEHGGDEQTARNIVREQAQRMDLSLLNDLIDRHNRYYPIEANLPTDIKTGRWMLAGKPWEPLAPLTWQDFCS